eukprot:208276-Pleurochrysis_carterae.AAC.7
MPSTALHVNARGGRHCMLMLMLSALLGTYCHCYNTVLAGAASVPYPLRQASSVRDPTAVCRPS